eukprot:scaffold16070_cov81-Isochrysis_galbana.AAC.1
MRPPDCIVWASYRPPLSQRASTESMWTAWGQRGEGRGVACVRGARSDLWRRGWGLQLSPGPTALAGMRAPGWRWRRDGCG